MPNSSRSAVGEAVSMVFTKTLAVNSKASWSFMPDEFSATWGEAQEVWRRLEDVTFAALDLYIKLQYIG